MLEVICIIGASVLLSLFLIPLVYVVIDTNLIILDELGLIDRQKWINKK
jgi:hypothetical protein